MLVIVSRIKKSGERVRKPVRIIEATSLDDAEHQFNTWRNTANKYGVYPIDERYTDFLYENADSSYLMDELVELGIA